MLQSGWLDNGALTIYRFPYRQSRQFKWLFVTVKNKSFQENGIEIIDRGL